MIMALVHKSALNLVSLSSLLCVAVLFIALRPCKSQDTPATSVPPDLLAGLNIGKLSSKVEIIGTLVNPFKFELKFKTINALLMLFDLQDNVNDQLQLLSSSLEGDRVEEYSNLFTSQAILESIIQTSCNYINQTLSDFYIDIPNYGCDGFVPSPRSFACSREAATQLQVLLEFWMLNRDTYSDLKRLCIEQGDCRSTSRRDWVNQLNLDASDPAELKVKKYLNCII